MVITVIKIIVSRDQSFNKIMIFAVALLQKRKVQEWPQGEGVVVAQVVG